MTFKSQHTADQALFIGDGEMAQLMREHDWASTSLGPVAFWPAALKNAMRLLLTSRFEMWMGWGPDILFFYNDAYRPTLGRKHPAALGTPTRELWAEIWDDIEPRLRRVYERGEATWDRALQLILNRHGYPEETYHTFSYSPLFDDDQRVQGVFCAVSEETERVLSQRRFALLSTLAVRLNPAYSLEAVYDATAAALLQGQRDLPFVLLYEFDAGGAAHLVGAVGAEPGSAAAPRTLGEGTRARWDVSGLWDGLGESVQASGGDTPTGPWDCAADEVLLVPLPGQGTGRPFGVMVAGLNPYRRLDEAYASFVQLVAGQVASGVASANAAQSERRRAQVLEEVARLRQEAADKLREANEQLAGEVRLRTLESERLRALFEQAPSFMCLLDGPEHTYELANEAYRQLVGHRELLGKPVRKALPEVSGQGFFELLDGVFASGEPYVGRNLPVLLQRSPGAQPEQRFVHLVYQPLKGADGRMRGIFVDGYDVTDQRRAEEALQAVNETLETRVRQRTSELAQALERLQQETRQRAQAQEALKQAQRMEALGQLTGGVAHDFNNLLQVISGNLQMLTREFAGNERAESRLRAALGGVARGAKLASQLLSFGRRQPLEPKVVNMGRLLGSMDDMMRRTLGEEIELETLVSSGLWHAQLDPGQLENAVLNLAINSRDAMDGSGRLTIEVRNAQLDADDARAHDDVRVGQYVMLAVGDTGSGMPAEVLQQAFEPFFSTKPEGKGTGLGLSMVYGFVKQSGGHVKIDSEVGLGTTVRLYFPRALGQEDELVEPVEGAVRGGSETILVVEDDAAVRETVVGLLGELGYCVLAARDAAGAYGVIEGGAAIDLVLTDVVMPGPMRSTELARRVKERRPGVCVLFTSGYTEDAIVHGGRLDPGVELLSKPYTHEALARKVRQLLDARPAAVEAAPPEPGPGPEAAPLRPLRLLVVEDDEFIREAVVEMLAAPDVQVRNVGDAPAALALLAEQRFDMLFTDVGLPRVSGLELAKQARERDPSLPIAFLTGDGRDPALGQVARSTVLLKPFFDEDLEAALTLLLGDRTSRERLRRETP